MLSHSAHTEQGAREYQEDRHAVINVADNITLAVVCDGHGGDACSDASIKHFVARFQSVYKDKVERNIRPNIICLLRNVVEDTVLQWDRKSLGVRAMNKIYDNPQQATRDAIFARQSKKALRAYVAQGLDAGTTLSACVIDLNLMKIHTINLGDSRTVICNDQSVISTMDHSVNLATAQRRGIPVQDGRVAGELAMMAAIGDNTDTLAGLVSRRCGSNTVKITGNSQIILGSDGFFDVAEQSTYTTTATAFELIAEARPEGGEYDDNVTVICLQVTFDTEHNDLSAMVDDMSIG